MKQNRDYEGMVGMLRSMAGSINSPMKVQWRKRHKDSGELEHVLLVDDKVESKLYIDGVLKHRSGRNGSIGTAPDC